MTDLRRYLNLIEAQSAPIPTSLFHGSTNRIEEVKPFIHIGSYNAAVHRGAVVAFRETKADPMAQIIIHEFIPTFTNPIFIQDLSGKGATHNSPSDYADLLPKTMRVQLSKKGYSWITLAEVLIENGYDSLSYRNNFEDAGSISYVVVDPKTIGIKTTSIITLKEAAAHLGVEL